MKTMKYLMTAVVCTLLASCMADTDSFDKPKLDEPPYGNNKIECTHLVTIKELKDAYKTPMTTDYRNGDSFEKVTEETQIRGFVTANDISGNIYNEVAIQDETGAILIEIQQGGLYGYLPVGTEIIVELKGLYVGNYRMQPMIGMPSKVSQGANKGLDQIGKISRMEWQDHFRITGNKGTVEPKIFGNDYKDKWDDFEDAGKLGKMERVTFSKGSYYNGVTSVPLPYDDKAQFANPELNASMSWYLNGFPTTVMLYNSNYSDFAANLLPHTKVSVTGVVKRYNSNWEIIMRDINDIEIHNE